MSKIIWSRAERRFSNGALGSVGKYVCFGVHWDSISSNTEDAPYILTSKLPGIKDVIGRFKNEKSAKIVADDVLKIWMKNTNLKHKK